MVLQATKRSVFPRPVRRGVGQEFSVGALNAAGTLFPSFGITAPTANVGTTVAVLSGNPTYSALPAAQSVSDVAANAIGNLSDNQKSLLVNNETMDLTGAGMDPQTAAQYAQSDVTGQLSAMNAAMCGRSEVRPLKAEIRSMSEESNRNPCFISSAMPLANCRSGKVSSRAGSVYTA